MLPGLTVGFDPWRELTPANCLLTSMHGPGHVHTQREGSEKGSEKERGETHTEKEVREEGKEKSRGRGGREGEGRGREGGSAG